MSGFTTERIFPLRNKGEATSEEIISEISDYITEINKWLHMQKNKKFSITGGIDSRISLALAKPIVDELEFFTYLKPLQHIKNQKRFNIYRQDENIVQNIVDNLRIKHKFFKINKNLEDRYYYNKIRKVVSSNHSYALSKYFYDDKQYHNALHIKSTIQSIGKTSFKDELYKYNDFDTLVHGSKRWASRELVKGESDTDIITVVTEFMKRTDLTFEKIYDYHILDILFLESRLGNFQSIITQETDNTLEIFNYFNSRKLITSLLQPTLEDRHSGKLYLSLINHYWPLLNFFGVNEETNLYTKYQNLNEKIEKEKVERLSKFQIETTSNLKTVENFDEMLLIIRPYNIPIKPDDNYNFTITNTSNSNKVLKMRSKYNNHKGKNIFTLIFDNNEIDIVDAYKGEYIILKPSESKKVILNVKEERKRESWLEAATVILEV